MKGQDVTGVDPSPAMLDIARRRRCGDKIEWALATAQRYRSAKRFDLVIMTGHAFQVLQEEVDMLATFETMRQHLAAGGLIAFESRNPSIDWASCWDYDIVLQTPRGAVYESRRFLVMQDDRMTFELHY